MKRYVSQSIIDEILQSESKETRIKDLFKLYGKFVVFVLLVNILMILALVKGISSKSVIPSIGIFIFEIYYFVRFYNASVAAPRTYNQMIEKIGKAQLISEMSNPGSNVFIVKEWNIETYTFVTEHYLVIAHACAYSISDIAKIQMIRKSYSGNRWRNVSPEWEDIYRHVYKIKITSKSGKVQKTVVCLLKKDANEFGALMKKRDVIFSIRDFEWEKP